MVKNHRLRQSQITAMHRTNCMGHSRSMFCAATVAKSKHGVHLSTILLPHDSNHCGKTSSAPIWFPIVDRTHDHDDDLEPKIDRAGGRQAAHIVPVHGGDV